MNDHSQQTSAQGRPAERRRHEDDPDELPRVGGAEGGDDSEAAEALPSHPARDSSPWGDTDQHSTS